MRLRSFEVPVGELTIGSRSWRTARRWVVDVDGATSTIIAASLAHQEDLIPTAESLVGGIEFHP